MGFLEFNKCCCCCNLRVGALVLGYLGLIGSLLLIGGVVMSMQGVQLDDGAVVKLEPSIAVPMLIMYAISLIFYALLLVGIHKNRPGFVKAGIIYMVVFVVLNMIFNCLNPTYQNAPGIISILVGTAISAYFILCIRSYYLVMNEERFKPQGNA